MNELQQSTARAIVNVFETGRIQGRYSAIAVLKGDTGHLSYGRSQASLGSGALFDLLEAYCQSDNAEQAVPLREYLPALKNRDFTLDGNSKLRGLLKLAAADPVMWLTQDHFFDSRYLAPACRAADALGIVEPLGATLIYDSCIQGGWSKLEPRIGRVGNQGAKDWIRRYIALRRDWLKSLNPPLPSTTYRMDSFDALVQEEKWNLELPLTVHGRTITLGSLVQDTPAQAQRTLLLTSPYLRGEDVTALQQALQREHAPVTVDGIYGAFTSSIVEQWKTQKGIQEDGAGPKTRQSLAMT